MSWRSPRGRVAWPRSSPPELRPALPPARPGRVAPVVVAADEAAEPAGGDPHERRAAGGGCGRAALDRASPRHAAERVPGRVDRRRGRPSHRVRPLGDAQRGHLHRARHRHVEQYARRGLRSRQPHRRRQTDRDRVRAGAEVGPHRARGVRRPGPHPGPDHHRLRGAGAGAQGPAHRDAGGRHRDRHGDRDRGEPAAARARQEQGDRAAHRRREQPRHRGPTHGGAGRGRVGDQDLRHRGGEAGGGPGAHGAGPRGPALPDDAGRDRRAADDRDRLDDRRALLSRHHAQSVRNVFAEINRLEKTPVEQVVYRRFDEAYRTPLALGLVALALEIVVAGTFAVRVP